ncbi:hypothetical protein RHMOL_Rhmol01G0375600 [Rhododendron molle]|uniref:Uncharacterized protein n=1 Tax=Rhododendron molle TaxID=49168 RepID=A0ACC0QBA8_RHOML|nr:hypothetical protein RHMOL_Rhmol01G0375600 [Rhododendron molle]
MTFIPQINRSQRFLCYFPSLSLQWRPRPPSPPPSSSPSLLFYEDDYADTGIPLPNITKGVLSKVIEYCKKTMSRRRRLPIMTIAQPVISSILGVVVTDGNEHQNITCRLDLRTRRRCDGVGTRSFLHSYGSNFLKSATQSKLQSHDRHQFSNGNGEGGGFGKVIW